MCKHNGFPHNDCDRCGNAQHAVCPHNLLLGTGCVSCYNAGSDWGFNAPTTDPVLNCLYGYPQQYPPAQAPTRDLIFRQTPPTPIYDPGAVYPQTIDPSQITNNAKPTPPVVDKLYPQGVARYAQYRSRLVQLLESPCIRDCTTDDAEHTRHFFTKAQGEIGMFYRCTVKDCDGSFPRLDRATIHFRTHIGHRPFLCEGCEKPNCVESFYANETRKAHMHKKMTKCEQCGTPLEAKNLKRHQEQTKACKLRTAE